MTRMILTAPHQRTGRDHQGVIVSRGWTPSSEIWQPTVSHRMKKSSWLRTALCGCWCLCMALSTPSGARQKKRRRRRLMNGTRVSLHSTELQETKQDIDVIDVCWSSISHAVKHHHQNSLTVKTTEIPQELLCKRPRPSISLREFWWGMNKGQCQWTIFRCWGQSNKCPSLLWC